MQSFEFMEIHKLMQYTNPDKPLVVFGCYNERDVHIINRHKGTVVIQWEGLDSKRHADLSVFNKSNIINVSPLKNVVAYLKTKGLDCKEIKFSIAEALMPQKLGIKVYAYIHKNNPIYYGGNIIKQLNVPYPFLIADYTIPQEKFRGAIRDEFYSQAFVGIQASEFAGGGMGIVEMGLRGIKVITNILNLPHTIPWKTIEDIERAIHREAKLIGTTNEELAKQVYDAVLTPTRIKCYDLEQLIKQQ
jgi:hypothetical protein